MTVTPVRPRVSGLQWVDRLKGVAMLWVVLNHVVERLAGGNFAGDPTGDWPPLAARIAQFSSGVNGQGVLDGPLTVLRDVGWLGDQAVTIFIILSGFGLTLGLSGKTSERLDTRDFYSRRLRRIYPLWWGAHILFLPTGLLMASGLSTGDWQFYFSFAGLRSVPGVFSYFSSSWWYVGLIIQLYLVFPLLWRLLIARGALVVLAVSCSAGFLALAIGHTVLPGELLEMWQRGMCGATRLPEFAFGMVLATWWARNPARGDATLRRPRLRAAAFAAYCAGFALSFTLPGMIVAPTVLGVAAIVLLYPAMSWHATGRGALEFIGRHSFSIYLTHFWTLLLVRSGATIAATTAALLFAAVATTAATFVLERGTAAAEAAFGRFDRAHGRVAALAVLTGVALALIGLPVAADLGVRIFASQELSRWSETAALEPDAAFGWRLIPSRTTVLHRVRDYRIEANALGFPGPELALRKPADALRIFVVGDQISSAEGLDTEAAWPRVLATNLSAHGRPAEVANFSITGYGPNQEASVVRAYAPPYRPDVVLVEMYPDDIEDVLTETSTLLRRIGVVEPSPYNLRAILGLTQLHAYLRTHLYAPLKERLDDGGSGNGYTFGGFAYLERGHANWDDDAVAQSAARYRDIASAAQAVGARTILVLVPNPAQVCGRLDASRFDAGLPERRARRIAAGAHLPLWDVRQDLRAIGCPYAVADRLLRPQAHRAIAASLARRMSALASQAP